MSTNAGFLEDYYMIDHKALDWVVLEEIQKKIIQNPIRNKLEENPPLPYHVVTPEPCRSGRMVRPPNKFILPGESYEAISDDHEQDPCSYDEAIANKGSGCWQRAMKLKWSPCTPIKSGHL